MPPTYNPIACPKPWRRCTLAIESDNRVSDPNYYLREQNQLQTQFQGDLSRILGIEGTFDPAAYDRLMRGFQPDLINGKETKLTMRLDSDRVMAWDWTFNNPKSVSVAKLVGGDSRIDEVENRAWKKTMDLIESQATVKVRKKSEIAKSKQKHPKGWKYPERKTGNLLYIAFKHPASRSGDPNSHTHLVVLNLSYDQEEKSFKAVNLKHVDRKAAGELYQSEMRKGLHQLGYKTQAVGKEYEIVGFPAEVKAKYSGRHGQIVEKQQEMETRIGKPMGSKARGKLSLYNRPEKAADMPLPERQKGWLSQLTGTQLHAVKGLVTKAKTKVSLDRWQAGMRKGYEAFRERANRSVEQVPERSRTR